MEETQNPIQSSVEEQKKRYFRFLGNPRYYIWGLVVILAFVTVYTTFAVQKNLWPFHTITPISPIVGGDRDAHGCIGSAGYQWCEVKQKCLRIWEEPCQ